MTEKSQSTTANRLTSADLDALMIARSVCCNAIEHGTTALPARVQEAADRIEALIRANTPFPQEPAT